MSVVVSEILQAHAISSPAFSSPSGPSIHPTILPVSPSRCCCSPTATQSFLLKLLAIRFAEFCDFLPQFVDELFDGSLHLKAFLGSTRFLLSSHPHAESNPNPYNASPPGDPFLVYFSVARPFPKSFLTRMQRHSLQTIFFGVGSSTPLMPNE